MTLAARIAPRSLPHYHRAGGLRLPDRCGEPPGTAVRCGGGALEAREGTGRARDRRRSTPHVAGVMVVALAGASASFRLFVDGFALGFVDQH